MPALGNRDAFARGIVVDSNNGNVYITGKGTGGSFDEYRFTVAFDRGGQGLWQEPIRFPPPSRGFGIAVDSSGNVYATGDGYIGTTENYNTKAFDSAGHTLWEQFYNGGQRNGDTAFAIAIDNATGNVYVTGQSPGSRSGLDYATIMYSQP